MAKGSGIFLFHWVPKMMELILRKEHFQRNCNAVLYTKWEEEEVAAEVELVGRGIG